MAFLTSKPPTHMRPHRSASATPKRTRQRFSRRLVLAAILGTSVSCLSPTLPLPPPNRPTIDGPDPAGNVTLSGTVAPGANVYADNLTTGTSSGQMADYQSGYYQFKIAAQVGDRMDLFYRYQSETSDRLNFIVPRSTSSSIAGGGTIYAIGDAGH